LKKKRFCKFGPFVIDTAAKVVLRDGHPMHLTRKAVETLLVLAENCEQIVTKEELLTAVWTGQIVDDANLKQNIAVIRHAMAVDSDSPGHIETYSRRGYRMIGPVEYVDEAPLAPSGPNGSKPALESFYRRARTPVIAGIVIAIGLSTWIAFRERPQSRVDFRVIPVTRLAGKEFQPAISADGRKVAFAWTQEVAGPTGISIQPVGSANPQTVTKQPGRYVSPAWSPDGKSLAYLRTSTASTEVLISDLGSGKERLVADLPTPDYGYDYRLLDWSPDGRLLAAAHSESADTPLGIFLIDIQTGERRRLTQPGASVGGDVDPRFSPDGKSVSFVRIIHRSNQELFIVPIEGGTPRQLTTDGKQVAGHDWTPNSKSIIFSSDRGGEFRLWRIDPLRTSPGNSLRSIGIYGEFPIQLSLARKSPALVYSELHQDRNIWRLDLKENRWTRVVASSGQDASPQYSPSGDRICFRSDRSGEDQLWVSDADGANPAQITHGTLWPSVGHWSPDGQSIVFNNARTRETYVARSGTTGAWKVTKLGAQGVHPVFSADGRWIFAGSDESIVRIPAQGGTPSELVKARGLSIGVSPDGAFLYFMRDPYGSSLWRASLSTGEVTKALDGVIPSCTSCWALAPGGIYYVGSGPQSAAEHVIYYTDLRSRKTREVTPYPEPFPPLGSGPFSLSPDRRYLLCVRVDPSSSDVMRVEPFR